MNISSLIRMMFVGTSEGVRKSWDTRGRKGPDEGQPISDVKELGEGWIAKDGTYYKNDPFGSNPNDTHEDNASRNHLSDKGVGMFMTGRAIKNGHVRIEFGHGIYGFEGMLSSHEAIENIRSAMAAIPPDKQIAIELWKDERGGDVKELTYDNPGEAYEGLGTLLESEE